MELRMKAAGEMARKTSPAYKDTGREKFLNELKPQELLVGTGSYPCVFKLGNSFFDYTPFKIYQQTWPAQNVTYGINMTTGQPEIQYRDMFNFGWC